MVAQAGDLGAASAGQLPKAQGGGRGEEGAYAKVRDRRSEAANAADGADHRLRKWWAILDSNQ